MLNVSGEMNIKDFYSILCISISSIKLMIQGQITPKAIMFKQVIIINLINKQEQLELHHAVVNLLCPETLKNPEDLTK